MKRILFVEDDLRYQKIIEDLLLGSNYEVDAVDDSLLAVEMFKAKNYDLVLSDLKMKDLDGLQFTSIIRRINKSVPIIILTNDDNYRKEVEGLDLGVSDYIYKAVSMEVLLKRIEVVAHRKFVDNTQKSLIAEKDNILIDCDRAKVMQDDVEIHLTRKEYNLLVFFLQNKNIILTREDILHSVWHVDHEQVDPRSIDTYVKKLRDKLRITSLTSIRGIGYEWFD